MFVLGNTWAALTRKSWRTLLTMAVALIIAFTTAFGLTMLQAGDTATGSAYAAQKPTATIRLTPSMQAKRNGADPNWTKHYLSWANYTTYATALQNASLTFTYSLQESVPVRQTSSFKADAGTADQPASQTGGEFTLRAMYSAQAMDSNDFGAYTIAQGKQLDFSTSSTDSTQALISQSVAAKNKLKVGDTFTVANPNNGSKTTKLKVQGIYTYTGNAPAGKGADAKLAKDNRDNAIYVGYYVFGKNGFDASNAKGWAIPDLNIIFIMSSVQDYQKFVQLVTKAKLPAGYAVSSPSLDAYQARIAPLAKFASGMRIALIVAWSLAGLLLLALVILGVSGRRGEIANDLIIGVSKGRIGWQFMLEVLLPVLPALAVGALVGGFVAGPLGSALTTNQVAGPTVSLIWRLVWLGLAVAFALAIIAMQWVAWFRPASLFEPREEVMA